MLRRTFVPPPKLRDREPGSIAPVELRGSYAHSGLRAAPKDDPVRHEGYRRLVAAMPCKHCGISGYSQAAHPNTGKGAGTKTDDRLCFPLCTVHPGPFWALVQGCHADFDQGALFPKAVRRALEPVWGADTRRAIIAAGQWPEDLERME